MRQQMRTQRRPLHTQGGIWNLTSPPLSHSCDTEHFKRWLRCVFPLGPATAAPFGLTSPVFTMRVAYPHSV